MRISAMVWLVISASLSSTPVLAAQAVDACLAQPPQNPQLQPLSPSQGLARPATGVNDMPAASDSRLQNCNLALQQTDLTSITRAEVYAALAGLHLQDRSLAQAQMALDAAMALAPTDALVLANQGTLHLYASNYADAVQSYTEALAQPNARKERMALHFNRALALRALGQYANAKEDYLSYLELRAQHAQPSVEVLDSDTYNALSE